MKLSTKGRYAITAMMSIAISERSKPLTLADIAKAQGISVSYFEQIFSKLRTAGIVAGLRGPGGGYRLGRPAHLISITDIIDALEEELENTVDATDLAKTVLNRPDQMWSELSTKVHEYLAGLTLDQFMHEKDFPNLIQEKETTASLIASMFKPRSAMTT